MSSQLTMALVIGASVKGALGGLKTLGDSVKSLNDKCVTTQTKLKNFSSSALSGFKHATASLLGVGSSIAALSQGAIDFESAMADVRKVVDFDTPEQFHKMEKDLLALSRVIPLNVEKLAQIAAAGGQLGVAREDIKSFTEQIAKMSVAFDMSAEESGDAMAKLANVYKIPIKEISNLGDAINDLSNSSPAKAREIVETLGRVGGVAKQFGLTANGATALGGAFIALGKRPEVAGTAINGMLTKLMTADKQGAKFQQSLKAMGMSAKGLKKAIAQNGEQALVDFLKAVQKLPKDQQMGALTDLFGLEYADDVAVLTGNIELLENNLKRLSGGKYLGSMQKEFNARSATTANSIILLKNGLSEIGIVVGSVLLPKINLFISKLRPMVYSCVEWASKNKPLLNSILKIGAGVIGVYASLNLFLGVAGSVVGTGLKLHKGFVGLVKVAKLFKLGFVKLLPILSSTIAILKGLTIGLVKLGIAFLSTPIGWVVVGITALVAGFIYLWRNCEGFRKFWISLWEGIKSVSITVFDAVGNFFIEKWTWVKEAFSAIADWISSKTCCQQAPDDVTGQANIGGPQRRHNIKQYTDYFTRPDVPEPLLCRVDNESTHWLQRLKAIGNGQDPLVMATAYMLLSNTL